MRFMGIGLCPAADGKAIVGVEELNGFQAAGHARVLQLPCSPTVSRMPDYAAVAHGPAAIGIDERDGGQLSIGQHLGRPRLGLRASYSGCPNSNGGEKYPVPGTECRVRTCGSHSNRLPTGSETLNPEP